VLIYFTGELVDIVGRSKGRGFTGTMKDGILVVFQNLTVTGIIGL